MNSHLVINMNDAIETARTFRNEGFVWVRKHKGYWWLYDSKRIDHLIMKVNGFEPGITVSIDSHNRVESGQMIMIDKDEISHQFVPKLKVEFDPPPFTIWGAFSMRYGEMKSSMMGEELLNTLLNQIID